MTNTIIRASAGSGKTFQLSNEYLGIVFRDEPIETILASTFTRKAAGEILDRILQRLADAALDETKCRDLARFVPLPRDAESDEPTEVLQRELADLVRNLYRLRIGTLDSFFNKIASSFAPELGFPPGWSMLEENEFTRLLEEAVRRVLADSHRNEARKLMNLLQKGEQDRNVTRELVELAAQLLPLIRETAAEQWNHDRLRARELDAAELQRILDRLQAAEIPKNKDGSLPKRFVQAKEKIGVLAMNEQWKEILGQTLVKNVAADELRFDRKEVEGELLDTVRALIDQSKAVLLNKLVGQTWATRCLLDLISEAYDEILMREGAFRFEDITQRLARDDFAPTLDLLAHRMDARTNHLLLDEFQDTSMPQWKVLRPFAEQASTTKNGSFFCVGDVKQAIYAWRGGVSGIFDTIEEEIKDVRSKPLNRNFRSSPVIMETVNTLFRSIASNEALHPYPEATESWGRGFQEHVADKENMPGHCTLEVAPSLADLKNGDDDPPSDEDGEDEDKLFFEYVIDRIVQLHRTRPEASLGVLVARNKRIGELIAGLKQRGIEASEEGGNPLTDSAAVLHVLSALILADHPGDRIARFHLANGPLAECLDLHDHDDDRQAARCARQIRYELLTDGYGTVVRRYLEALAPACHAREFQRLEKLLELAYQFQDSSVGLRTRRFVEMVRTTKVESPTASKIRIMTIHKSKGLEFDIVVLPDLDNRLVKQAPKVLVDRESSTGPIRFVLRYAPKEVQTLMPPAYQHVFAARVEGEVVESLSLLYVAITRAVHELVMIVPPLSAAAKANLEKGKASYPSTFAGILRAGLARNAEPDASIPYQTGASDWYERLKRDRPDKPLHETDIPQPEQLECQPTQKAGASIRNLPRVSPSSLETEPAPVLETDPVAAPSFSKRSREDARLRGIAIHACFQYGLEQCPWLDQGEPDQRELERIVRTAVRDKKGTVDPQEIIRSFLAACAQPNTRRALSLSSYGQSADPASFEVEHERRFSVLISGPRLLHGSIDRLVIRREKGVVVALEIVDYKTDRPRSGEDLETFLRDREASYRPQMEAYREGMARLYRLAPSAISGKLLFVRPDRVVKLF